MKLGLLFSGQGSQKPGMGLDFLSDPLFEKTIAECSMRTGLDLEKVMASKNGELKQTANVQPALVAVSYGIYQMLIRDLPQLPVVAMAGLSLGEYGALLASHALSVEQGLPLLADRGRYMQADANRISSSMAAILNPEISKVEEICKHYSQVWVANYNSPKQVVVGGELTQLEKAVGELTAEKAGKRVVTLRVSGAFHTPLFNGARDKMHERLAKVTFQQPTVPVISNTTVIEFNVNTLAQVLEKQLAVPTHFGEDINYMINHQEVDATLEIGPGKTLSRFAKQVNRKIDHANIGTMDEYQAYLKENQKWS